MIRVLDIGAAEILPDPQAVLAQQGVPPQADGFDQLLTLAEAACRELAATLAPAGVLREVTGREFAAIYPGQGFNDSQTPLAEIHPRAERLALFVVTCGQSVVDRIGEFFQANEFPLGAALDAGASLAADQAAQVAQDRFAATLDPSYGVLRYSPGYCGWHVSGQKALFDFLGSDPACVTLTDSCLMQPLKSVSGVIVAGPSAIHRFVNDYTFCTACTNQECRERILSVMVPPENEV